MRFFRYQDMRFACLFSFFVLLVSPSAFAAETGACESDEVPGMINSSDYGGEETLRLTSEAISPPPKPAQHYFSKACQDPEALKDRPSTGLFRREVPFFDRRGRSSVDFLKRVSRRVITNQDVLSQDLVEIESCLEKPAGLKACADVDRWHTEAVLPLVRESRFHLALAQTLTNPLTNPSGAKSFLIRANHDLNRDLSALGTRKEKPWMPLNTDETTSANGTLRRYEEQIETEAQRELKIGLLQAKDVADFKNKALYAAQIMHGNEYSKTAHSYPILQYIQSAKPSRLETLEAVRKIHANLKGDRNRAIFATKLAQQVFAPSRGRRDGFIRGEKRTSVDPDALYLLSFLSQVEAELLEHPKDCGLAISLLETRENIALGNGLAAGGALLAASVALPIVGQTGAASALATLGGVGFIVAAKNDRDQAIQHFASELEKSDATDYQTLDRANANLKIAIGLGVAAPAAGPLTRAGLGGLRAGLRVFKTTPRPPPPTGPISRLPGS